MKISIENGAENQKRIMGENGMLVGLITKKAEREFRVEMLMTVNVTHSNWDRAIGFAYGFAAASSK